MATPEKERPAAPAPEGAAETPRKVEVRTEKKETAPEAAPEQVAEQPTVAEQVQPAPEPVQPAAVQAAPAEVDPLAKEIDAVLAEDLTDLFLKLPPAEQTAFKTKGEETATAIRGLMDNARENAKQIFSLIKEWLKMLPGVNSFFLEQEAKIKTDKLVLIAEEQQGSTQERIA